MKGIWLLSCLVISLFMQIRSALKAKECISKVSLTSSQASSSNRQVHLIYPADEVQFKLRYSEIQSIIGNVRSRNVSLKLFSFPSSSDGGVLHCNQDYIRFLLQLDEGKLDLKCRLSSLERRDEFYLCIFSRALIQKANLLLISTFDFELTFLDRSAIESTLFCLNSSLPGSEVKEEFLPAVFDSILEDSLPSSHEDGSCKLWWPLNFTDLLLYNHIPENLPFLRIRQKIILSCNFDRTLFKGRTVQVSPVATVVDVVERNDSELFHYERIHRQTILFEKTSTNIQDADSLSTLLSFEVPLEFILSQQSIRMKKITLTIELQHEVISQFSIYQNIHYLNEHIKGQQQNADYSTQPQFPSLSNWLGRIESRDDFGFFLSSVFHDNHHRYNISTIFVEVGVNKGNFAQTILNTWPTLSLYIGIDSWKRWAPADDYIDLANDDEHEENYRSTLNTLQDIPTNTTKLLIHQESTTAALLFEDESIDVVYIDAMHHYAAVYQDLMTWWPKVKRGGIMAGHDYLLGVESDTIFTVKPAVEKFAWERNLIILQTIERDCPSFPSWFIIKQ